MGCPQGGEHELAEDYDGAYCTKCLEPVARTHAKPKRAAAAVAGDSEITKSIKKLVDLMDKRAKRLKCLNGRGHTACLDAINNLMNEWNAWRER